MAEVAGQGHNKECSESVGAVCICECRGRMHGMRANRTAKLRRMGEVHVTAVHGARAAAAKTSTERRNNPVTLRTSAGSAIIDVQVRKDGSIKESRAAKLRAEHEPRVKKPAEQVPAKAVGSNEPLWKNARTGEAVKYPGKHEITSGVVVRDRQAENLRAAQNAGEGDAVVHDLFGDATGLLGGTRSSNDVAPKRPGQQGQQLGMFDAGQGQLDGQQGLFGGMNPDAVADGYHRPTPPVQVKPDAHQVPADLSTLDDDRIAELVGKTDDEPTLARLLNELDKREDAERYRGVVDAVPDAQAIQHIGDDELEGHLLGLTSVHHEPDHEALGRVEAELARRDGEEAERQRNLDVVHQHIDQVVRDQSTSDADLEEAAQLAAQIGDEGRIGAVYDEWDRREKAQQAKLDAEHQARQKADADALAARQEAARVEAARVAKEQADADALDREFQAMYPSQLSSEFVQNAASMDPQKQRRHAAAVKELDRRAEEKKAADARQKIIDRRERISRGPVRKLADDELNEAIAGIEADGFNSNTVRQNRLGELREEKARRDTENARVDALKAAVPTGPARVSNPIGALGDMVRWSEHDSSMRDRLVKARMSALGVPEPEVNAPNQWAAHKEREKARKKAIAEYAAGDPRSAQEQAATIIAHYRHLALIDDVKPDSEFTRDRVLGPADDQHAPPLVEAAPFEKIPKAYEQFQDIRRQAMADRAEGNNATADRAQKAYRRALGLPDDASDDDVRSAYGADERSSGDLASQMLVEFRKQAKADGVDPDDRLRFGPKEKKPSAKASAGYRAKTSPQQQAELDRRIADGEDYIEAYAAVHGLDADAMRREQGPKLTSAQVKEAYEEHVHLQYLDAETATRGHLLSPKGKAAGKDPVTLFSGSLNQVRTFASEELLRYWQQHERLTFADFKANVAGDTAAIKARASRSNGKDFV